MNEPTQPIPTSLSVSPHTLFAVLTRVIGLSYLAGAACNLWSGLWNGMLWPFLRDSIAQVAVGCFLIFGAAMVQRLLYPVEVPSPRA